MLKMVRKWNVWNCLHKWILLCSKVLCLISWLIKLQWKHLRLLILQKIFKSLKNDTLCKMQKCLHCVANQDTQTLRAIVKEAQNATWVKILESEISYDLNWSPVSGFIKIASWKFSVHMKEASFDNTPANDL